MYQNQQAYGELSFLIFKYKPGLKSTLRKNVSIKIMMIDAHAINYEFPLETGDDSHPSIGYKCCIMSKTIIIFYFEHFSKLDLIFEIKRPSPYSC